MKKYNCKINYDNNDVYFSERFIKIYYYKLYFNSLQKWVYKLGKGFCK